MFELRRIEEDISKKRIAALAAMESAAEEEIEFLDKVTQDTAKMVQDKESHLSEKLRLATELQKHRELAESADRAEKEKVRRMYMRRTREEVRTVILVSACKYWHTIAGCRTYHIY